MKIATFNVNSIKMRLPIVLSWLDHHQPDVLMIQELKGIDLPEAEFRAAGYHVHAVTQKAYNGVATLTRQPAILTHTRLPGTADDDDQARFLSITIAPITFINIYAPNGNPVGTDKFTYKINWLHALYEHLALLRQEQRDVVIGGDFNIIPTADDAANPHDWTHDALFTHEARALYQSILHLGYTDTIRALHPQNKTLYSFWDYQAGAWPRNHGIRIDHILTTPRLTDHLTTAIIDRAPRDLEKPSDHTPVMVEIEL